MKKRQVTRDAGGITLAALALILSFRLFGAQSSDNVKAQNNQTTTPGQNEKPFDQVQALADLRKAIAGQENKPAPEVFKNIQMLKAMPAGRLFESNGDGLCQVVGC